MHHFFIAFSLLAVIGQHESVQSSERRSERSTYREYKSMLYVKNGGQWGSWRTTEMCPSGTYATGFSLKVEKPIDGDDTALNAIRFHCVYWSKGVLSPIESGTGEWAFQLRVESPQGNEDDTTANNIKFRCSDGTVLEGDGTSWGEWGDWSQTCEGRGICGIKTRIESSQGKGDDTALNDVKMYCCD